MTILVATLTAAMPQPAAQARSKCDAQAAAGRTIAKSSSAIVFARRGTVYACERRAGGARKLPGQDRRSRIVTATAVAPRIAGRFVAYEGVRPGAADVPGSLLYVFDMRRRRTLYSPPAFTERPLTRVRVRSFALRRDGVVAWIGESSDGTAHQVLRIVPEDPGGGRETGPLVQVLDAEAGIAPRSLALSADRRTVYWTRGGATRSARL